MASYLDCGCVVIERTTTPRVLRKGLEWREELLKSVPFAGLI